MELESSAVELTKLEQEKQVILQEKEQAMIQARALASYAGLGY